MAARIGADVMADVVRGYVPGRSGDITLVPRPHWFVLTNEDQCGLVGGRPSVATTYAEPWNYLARVPLAFYGPGLIPSGRAVAEPATLASIAPTFASLVGMRGFQADAPVLDAVANGASGKPQVVVTVLLDGGGWDVLQNHVAAWPVMRSLFDRGTLYTNATNGSSPSITGAIMATVGTGRYPRTHGIPGNQMRGPASPWTRGTTRATRGSSRFRRSATTTTDRPATDRSRP
jgi:arylsulfatase A-like enzyme